MAENEVDGGQSGGTTQNTSSGGSNGQGDSGGSFDAQKLQSTIEALTKKLDEVDARSKALQGDKDRGITKTKEEVSDLKRKIAEIEKLKKTGLDEDGAIEEHSFREDVRSIKDQLSKLGSVQTQVSGKDEGLADDVAKVFADYEVDPNTPETTKFLSLKGSELKAAVADYAFRKTKHTPADSSEASSLQGKGAAGGKMTDAEANSKYSELKTLYRDPTINASKIKTLRKELSDSGYES